MINYHVYLRSRLFTSQETLDLYSSFSYLALSLTMSLSGLVLKAIYVVFHIQPIIVKQFIMSLDFQGNIVGTLRES